MLQYNATPHEAFAVYTNLVNNLLFFLSLSSSFSRFLHLSLSLSHTLLFLLFSPFPFLAEIDGFRVGVLIFSAQYRRSNLWRWFWFDGPGLLAYSGFWIGGSGSKALWGALPSLSLTRWFWYNPPIFSLGTE